MVSVPLPGFSIEKGFIQIIRGTKTRVSVPLPGFSIEKGCSSVILFLSSIVSVPLPGFSIEKAGHQPEEVRTEKFWETFQSRCRDSVLRKFETTKLLVSMHEVFQSRCRDSVLRKWLAGMKLNGIEKRCFSPVAGIQY